jgi:2-dehydro-3-deoxyphosphogluconate aldolase/(4S)-4-hydroxy-2-oxoglutarate aldolase
MVVMADAQEAKQARLTAVLRRGPVVPVITIDDEDAAPGLARALLRGGVTVLEVTLRTAAALGAIQRIAAEVPDVVVGAGTIANPGDIAAAEAAGATFVVSPGVTDPILAAADGSAMPLLPGVMTVSEAMRLADRGLRNLKLFPANVAGGPAFLAAIYAPFPQLRFCPTGGISPVSLQDYLRLPNVLCVGGSWLVPREVIVRRDWATITRLAAEIPPRVGSERPAA